MSIIKTPYFWISMSGIGLIGVSVAYAFSIETFGSKIGTSCCILPTEDDEVWKEAFKKREDQIKNLESSSRYSDSLDTLIRNTKNKESYGAGNEHLPLKNWCLSRYKDTYSSIFQKPKDKELEEIKEFCRKF